MNPKVVLFGMIILDALVVAIPAQEDDRRSLDGESIGVPGKC